MAPIFTFTHPRQTSASPGISQPIRYYNKDSLEFSSEKENLYGEIGGQHEPELPPRPASRSGYRRLLLLLSFIALVSLTSIIIYVTIICLWQRNFEHADVPVRRDWTNGFIIIPLGTSLISSTYIVLTQFRRRRQASRMLYDFAHHKAGYNVPTPDPFYLMLLSSTIILTLIPFLVLGSTNNSLARAFGAGPAPTNTASISTVCTVSNMLTRPCIPTLYRIGQLQLGGAITTGLCSSSWIVMLWISARSYIQKKREHKQRKEQRRRRREARRQARREGRQHTKSPHQNHNGDVDSRSNETTQKHNVSHDSPGVLPLKIPIRVHQPQNYTHYKPSIAASRTRRVQIPGGDAPASTTRPLSSPGVQRQTSGIICPPKSTLTTR